MENLFLLFGVLFLFGYFFITIEHISNINKSGVAIVLGGLLWLIIAIVSPDKKIVSHAIVENSSEIFAIVIFLLSAMTIVELLVHFQFFDWIREKITKKNISHVKLFWLLGLITFILSAVLDNLTTTLIMIQIGRKIYKNQNNFLIFTANTVIAANAGGAASPLGDVTTIMLWLAEKFNAIEIISMGIVPAIATWLVPQYILTRKIVKNGKQEEFEIDNNTIVKPYWSIIIVGLFSFTLPVLFNILGLPPFLGLLLGVGILWIFIDIKSLDGHKDHTSGRIVNIIQKTDITTLKFFIGILLAVGALGHIGLLSDIHTYIFGKEIIEYRLVVGNVFLGLLSSIVDNVPLVAAAIKMFPDGISQSIWVLLAITAGTGGSILVVGSAAGVAAMGQVKELNFVYYLKTATIPAILGYIAGVVVWILMFY